MVETEACQIPPIVFLNKKIFLPRTVEMLRLFKDMPFDRVLRSPQTEAVRY